MYVEHGFEHFNTEMANQSDAAFLIAREETKTVTNYLLLDKSMRYQILLSVARSVVFLFLKRQNTM
jgi:hypothetical protein